MSKRSFIDSLEVKNPCSESWDEMAGNDRVRFCSHCSKSVNNLSEMTRKEAIRLVRKSQGRLCVRYLKDPQTGAPVYRMAAQLARRSGVAAGALGASLALSGLAVAQGGAERPTPVHIEQRHKTEGSNASIAGHVTDPAGAVIATAIVSLTNQETSEYFVQTSSAEGFYEFTGLAAGTYKLKVEAGGFAVTELVDIRIESDSTVRRNAQLALQQVEEVVEVREQEVQWSVIVGAIGMDHEPRNPLIQAVLDEDLEGIKELFAKRPKPNVRDKSNDRMSALHAAVQTGNVEIVEFLLQHGAKPNIRDSQKRTPLMMMDEDAGPEMLQLLISYGARVDLVDKQKNNVLHYLAAAEDTSEVLRQLIISGANINAVNRQRKSALMAASENGNLTMVTLLLEYGADVHLRDKADADAWELADGPEIRDLLESYGAIDRSR